MSALPPGPRLPRRVQTALYALRPIGFVQACRQRYGDVFTLDIEPVGKLVCFCTPEAARAIYKANPDLLRSGEYSRTLLPDAIVSPETKAYRGPRSVLFLDGEEHLHDRQLLMPVFERSSVEGYHDLIEQITLEQIERLPRGRVFPLRQVTYSIALSVILRAVMGVQPSYRLQSMLATIPRLFSFNPILLAVPALRVGVGPVKPAARFHRLRSEVEQLLMAEIHARRAEGEGGDDVISRLLAASGLDGKPLSLVEIRDELQILMMAGTETTATALACGLERVLRSPATLAALRAELDAGGEEVLDAVIKEILRSSPVLMGAGRRVSADCEIAGHHIAANTMVRVAIPLLHSSAQLYEHPNCFCPSRHRGQQPPPYTWMPFGGGVRRCIGANLALMELKVVLSTLAQRVELRAAGRRTEGARFRSVFMTPARGSRVTYCGPRAPVQRELQPSGTPV